MKFDKSEEIRRRIRETQEKIEEYAKKAGRDPREIQILGATKTVPPDLIELAIEGGIRHFGENRVQEAAPKIPLIKEKVDWHMIGHLQSNKVRKALQLFSVIESLESESLIEELEKRANKPIDCLIEVNTSFEPSKYGLDPEDTMPFFEKLLKATKINPMGLMTLGPYPPEEKKSREAFSLLRELRDKLQERFSLKLPILSMGMTEDYHWAVLEGATEVRIGRGIFGERPLKD